jgi:GT2 family glycosyltransferase
VRDIERSELRAPAVVLDIDIDRVRGDEVVDVSQYSTAWCLVRRDTVAEEIRFLDIEVESSVAVAELRERFAASGGPKKVGPFAPLDSTLTVVICTRDRRDGLLKTLGSLAEQSDPRFDVLVVDNSLDGEIARTLVDFDGLALRCTHEPKPGLSRARNRGLTEVHSDLVAWIDDDEVADLDWTAWIKRGFATPGRPDVVAGMMLPAELETNAQVDWERYGGFNKGRGMEPTRLAAGTPTVSDPLYPRPLFGSGGNMAFRTEALQAIGGFENRLGTGTLTRGGEDTRTLALMLEGGSTILHWPPAITWHYHRRTDEALEKQVFGNSAGLTAFYMSLVMTSPKYLWRILGLLPRGLRSMLVDTGRGKETGLPRHLLRASRKGLIQGPWLYIRETRRQRRSARSR